MGWDPTKVKFKTGPNCEGCPYRERSVGFTVPQGWDYSYDPIRGVWERFGPGYLWRNAEYLFILEAPGKDEARQGYPLAGGTGRYFNGNLLRLAGLQRPAVAISNTVLCRPIKWTPCRACKGEGGTCGHCNGRGERPLKQSSGDYVNDKPSPSMVEECARRYTYSSLESASPHTVVGLGGTPLTLYAGRGKSIMQMRGAIFERGELVACGTCSGEGHVPRPRRKCPVCKDKKVQKCEECGRYKPTKKCTTTHLPCSECSGQGTLPRPPKTCPDCKGAKDVPSDPDNPYVSTLLKEGQVYLPSFHPAFVMRAEKYKSLLEFDMRRVPTLREELKVEQNLDYQEYPTPGTISDMFSRRVLSVDFETSTFQPEDGGEVQMTGASSRPGEAIIANGSNPEAIEWLKRASVDPSITLVGQNWMMFDA